MLALLTAAVLALPACHSPADWPVVPSGAVRLAQGASAALASRPSDVDAYRPRGRCSLPNGSVRWRAGRWVNVSGGPVVAFWWEG